MSGAGLQQLAARTPPAWGRGGRHRLVAALAVTQTVGYGALVQSFSVLLVPMTRELSASRTAITAAATLSILIGAVAAYPVGAVLDRFGGRTVMTVGSVVGVVGVLGWSQATGLTQLYCSFALVGLALAMSTYEAAFAVLVAVMDARHRDSAIITVSLITGFATSLYYPLSGWMESTWGWRTTLVLLAGSLAAVAVPLHVLSLPGRRAHARLASRRAGVPVGRAARTPTFWLLLVSFTAQAGATSAFLLLMVSYFLDVGHPSAVAVSLPLAVGVLQLLSRLGIAPLAARWGMSRVTAVSFAVQGIGLLALPLIGTSLPLTIACVAGFGLGYGVSVVARPSIVADTFGAARFASIFALLTIPIAVARAGMPVVAADLRDFRFLLVTGAACVLSAVALIPVIRRQSVTSGRS